MHRALRAAMMAAVLGGISLPVAAQPIPWEDRIFANVSFGVDTGSSDVAENRQFTIYGETGTFQTSAEFGTIPIFDIALGARVYRNFGIGLAYHTGNTDGSGTLSGSVPHPLFFDRPRSFNQSFSDAQRDEHATHLQFGYMATFSDSFDLFISGGPSFYRVTQEMVTGITLTEQGPPYTSVTVTPAITVQKQNVTGYNVGADATYLFYNADTFRVGVGGFLRFTGATAEFPADAGNTIETDLGGLQAAFGLRLRF